MGQIHDLVRSLRAQPQRVDLRQATAVLERAKAEGVAPDELRELQSLLNELKDKFAPEVRDSLTAFVEGGGDNQARPVHELVPETLAHAGTLDEVIQRFGSDFTLLRGQLVDAKGLGGAEKAERIFEFLLAYAEQFIKVANGEVKPPPKAPVEVVEGGLFGGPATGASADAESIAAGKVKLPPILPKGDPGPAPTPSPVPREERADKVRQFAQALKESGFSELKDPRTGRDAVAIASQLLSSKDVRELRARSEAVRLDAPASWSRDDSAQAAVQRSATASALRSVPREVTEALAAANAREKVRPEIDRVGAAKLDPMRVQPWQTEAGRQVVIRPAQREAGASSEETPRSARTNKVLGRNMLWNVLHTYREGPDGEMEAKLSSERLAFGAIMLLVAIAAAAILIVSVA